MNVMGLISGALGGAAKGYTQYAETELVKQQELDLRKQMLDAEEEKLLRIDEVKRNRDIADVPRLAKAEAEGQVAMTSTPGYLNSLAQRTSATESSATKASAAATNYELDRARQANTIRDQLSQTEDPQQRAALQRRLDDLTGAFDSPATRINYQTSAFELGQATALGDLRLQLARSTDPDERAVLQQAISDLSGTSTTRSYSDMVTAAGHYRMLAQNLRKDADTLAESDEERRTMLERAYNYEREADSILQMTKDKRLGGSGQNSGGTGTSGPKEGEEAVSKSGKPIVFRNGQWVYK